MKETLKSILGALALVIGLMVAAVFYYAWPRGGQETQVLQTQRSPDGRWTAVVQLEVSGASAADYAVYAVRLKGPAQKDRQGDLVMNAEVAYPVPRPFIRWSGGKLVVSLLDHEKYQYFANRVSGVVVEVQRK